jgi:phenylpropionate dioxygenase-like ring-hydroxylating dioxygenase large terminal subunit
MTMLNGAPWLLAHKSMLEINQPKKVSLLGQDYVLWKDREDRVMALPNACPHMGAMLSEGWCHEKKDKSSVAVCPFHALEFDAEGCTVLPGSEKKTLSQIDPLKLIIHDNFIWSYGDSDPQIPIPNILNEIESKYKFVGSIADVSVKTSLLSMLLNMHDYNHQNGTHRPLFSIEEVKFKSFGDYGHHSHAFYNLPKSRSSLIEKIKNPGLFLLPDVIPVHLENHFPSLVIFHGENPLGKIAQINLFIPESDNITRTYVLLYAIPKSPFFKLLENQFLKFAKAITEQDAYILSKIYEDTHQKIKLNNEVGMDWVRRNYASWPEISRPFFSK